MTGLMGGGHALWIDGDERPRDESRLLRRRSRARPPERGAAARAVRGAVRSRDRPLRGRDRLLRRAGRSGRARRALATARPPALGAPRRARAPHRARRRRRCRCAHALCLAMLAPVMTMRDGAEIFSPTGALLETGDRLVQPGLARALELVAEEGPDSMYAGTLGEALLGLMDERGGPSPGRPRRVRAAAGPSRSSRTTLGLRVATRGGLSRHRRDGLRAPSAAALARRPRGGAGSRPRGDTRERAHDEPRHRRLGRQRLRPHVEPRARLRRLPAGPPGAPELHARRDRADRRPARARRADAEHDGADRRVRLATGLVLALGSAGGSRLRSALVQTLAGDPRRGPRAAGGGRPASPPPRGPGRPRGAGVRRGSARGARARRASRCGAGRPGTTTSAASACALGGGAAADPRRSGAAVSLPS